MLPYNACHHRTAASDVDLRFGPDLTFLGSFLLLILAELQSDIGPGLPKWNPSPMPSHLVISAEFLNLLVECFLKVIHGTGPRTVCRHKH